MQLTPRNQRSTHAWLQQAAAGSGEQDCAAIAGVQRAVVVGFDRDDSGLLLTPLSDCDRHNQRRGRGGGALLLIVRPY